MSSCKNNIQETDTFYFVEVQKGTSCFSGPPYHWELQVRRVALWPRPSGSNRMRGPICFLLLIPFSSSLLWEYQNSQIMHQRSYSHPILDIPFLFMPSQTPPLCTPQLSLATFPIPHSLHLLWPSETLISSDDTAVLLSKGQFFFLSNNTLWLVEMNWTSYTGISSPLLHLPSKREAPHNTFCCCHWLPTHVVIVAGWLKMYALEPNIAWVWIPVLLLVWVLVCHLSSVLQLPCQENEIKWKVLKTMFETQYMIDICEILFLKVTFTSICLPSSMTIVHLKI